MLHCVLVACCPLSGRARPTAGHFAQVGVLCTKRGAHRERLSEGPLALSLHCLDVWRCPVPKLRGSAAGTEAHPTQPHPFAPSAPVAWFRSLCSRKVRFRIPL